MGKGDKRTRRGKIFARSYGKSRLQLKGRTTKKATGTSKTATAKKKTK